MMESATTITSRLGKTGYIAPGTSRQDTILAQVEEKTEGLINPDLLTVTSKYYSQFSQIGDPEPYTDTNSNGQYNAGEPYTDINGNGQWDSDMGLAGYGGPGAVVVYTVSYPWPIMTPIMRGLIGNAQGNFMINATSVVKNEPYDA
jgi:hypothetical protein